MMTSHDELPRALEHLTDSRLKQASAELAADPEAFSSARRLMNYTISDARRAAPLRGYFSFSNTDLESHLADKLCDWLTSEAETVLGGSDWLNSPSVFSLALPDLNAARRVVGVSSKVAEHLTDHSSAGIERLAARGELPTIIEEALAAEDPGGADPVLAYALFMTVFWRALTTVWASNAMSEEGLSVAERDILVELNRLAEVEVEEQFYNGPIGREAPVVDEDSGLGLRAVLAKSRTARVVALATAGIWVMLAVDGFLQLR